eukprot:Opistho-1_new@83486
MAANDEGNAGASVDTPLLEGHPVGVGFGGIEHIDDDERHFTKPSLREARLHAESLRIKDPADPSGSRDLPLNCPPGALAPYGAGVPLMLHFELCCAAIAFLFGILYGVPAAVLNMDGHIAAIQKWGAFKNCTRTPDVAHPPMYNWFLGNRKVMPGWPYFVADGGTVIVYIVVAMYLRMVLEKMARLYASEVRSARAYTVMCKGLPQNATDAEPFVRYFSRWGRVARVTVSLDSMRIMRLMEERKVAVRRLDVELAKRAGGRHWCLERLWYRMRGIDPVLRAQNTLALVDAYIFALKQTRTFRCSGYAFVTFATPQQAAACLEYHNGRSMILRAWNAITRFVTCQEQDKTFLGGPVSVREPPEPSDILWQNLDVGLLSRVLRNTATALASLFVVILGFIGILAVIVFSDLRRENENKSFVEEYGTKLAIGFVVILVNFILSTIVRALCAWECHHTHSSLQTAAAMKLLTCSMTNTSYSVFTAYLILALMSSNYDVHKAPAAFGTSFWYSAQGALGHVFWSIITGVGVMIAIQIVRPVTLARRAFAAVSSVTQEQLNERMRPPEPDIPSRHVTSVVAVFTSMFYASQMPLLPLVAGVGIVLQYAIDKYNLLRRQRPPPKTSGAVSVLMMRVVTWAGIVHVLLAGLAYVIGPWCNGSDPVIVRNFFSGPTHVNGTHAGMDFGEKGGGDLLWWHVWLFGWLCFATIGIFLQAFVRCTMCALKDLGITRGAAGARASDAEWPEYESLVAQRGGLRAADHDRRGVPPRVANRVGGIRANDRRDAAEH